MISTTTQRPRGGKGRASSSRSSEVSQVEYSYYGNFAVALCEGIVAGIGRVWADGQELDLSGVTFRLLISRTSASCITGVMFRSLKMSASTWFRNWFSTEKENSEPFPSPTDKVSAMQSYWEISHYKKAVGDRVISEVMKNEPQPLANWLETLKAEREKWKAGR